MQLFFFNSPQQFFIPVFPTVLPMLFWQNKKYSAYSILMDTIRKPWLKLEDEYQNLFICHFSLYTCQASKWCRNIMCALSTQLLGWYGVMCYMALENTPENCFPLYLNHNERTYRSVFSCGLSLRAQRCHYYALDKSAPNRESNYL